MDNEGEFLLAYPSCSYPAGIDDIKDIAVVTSNDMLHWSEPIYITKNSKNSLYPSIIQKSDGKYMVAWAQGMEIWISESDDSIHWSEPRKALTASKDYEKGVVRDK